MKVVAAGLVGLFLVSGGANAIIASATSNGTTTKVVTASSNGTTTSESTTTTTSTVQKDEQKAAEVAIVLAQASTSGEKVVKLEGTVALSINLMETLAENPDVTLEYTCTYQGIKYVFPLNAKMFTVEEDILWYGPLKLRNICDLAGVKYTME